MGSKTNTLSNEMRFIRPRHNSFFMLYAEVTIISRLVSLNRHKISQSVNAIESYQLKEMLFCLQQYIKAILCVHIFAVLAWITELKIIVLSDRR